MNAERKNIALLSACQALLFINSVTLIAISGLAGYALAADKGLATLPVTAQVIGSALATIPASLIMQRIGRRAGFQIGSNFNLVSNQQPGYRTHDKANHCTKALHHHTASVFKRACHWRKKALLGDTLSSHKINIHRH